MDVVYRRSAASDGRRPSTSTSVIGTGSRRWITISEVGNPSVDSKSGPARGAPVERRSSTDGAPVERQRSADGALTERRWSADGAPTER